MLDFFLVLGQVPGTHFYLTFTELLSAYSISLAAYILQREYRARKSFLVYARLVYVMYSHRLRPGRVRRREVLPAHINLTLRVNIDLHHLKLPRLIRSSA